MCSEQQDLHGGTLYWPSTCPAGPPIGSRLGQNIECDALVVGAGITGAMVAWELSRSGIQTVVVERGALAMGSTAASTAMLMYDLDLSLVELQALRGRDRADRAYRASNRTVTGLVNLVRQLDDHSDFSPRQSLLLASREADVCDLRKEAAARRLLGLDVEFHDADSLARTFLIRRPAGLLCGDAGEVNPVRLTLALLRGAAAKGTRIFDRTELHLPECARRPHTVRTSEGHTVRCRDLVIATGYAAPLHFAGVSELTTLKSTYALASRPLSNCPWPRGVLMWETARPYVYLRTTRDNRVIVGGEDTRVVDHRERDGGVGPATHRLLSKASGLTPGLDLVPEYSWAGTFAETADSLPLIGQTEQWPGVHFALGYGGNGMTFSALAAQIIRDSLTGRRNPDAELFSLATAMRAHGASA